MIALKLSSCKFPINKSVFSTTCEQHGYTSNFALINNVRSKSPIQRASCFFKSITFINWESENISADPVLITG